MFFGLANMLDHMYHGYDWYIGGMIVEITIDIDDPVPQFEQLIEQIKAAVTAGVLKPGDALPSTAALMFTRRPRRTASSTCRNGRCASSSNPSTSCAKRV
jgi:hypothetical protein